MSNTEILYDSELVLLSKQSISATGNGTGKQIGPTGLVKVAVIVTTAGTTLTLKFQESSDDSSYSDLGSMPAITAVGKYFFYFKATKEYIRHVISAITGTFEVEIVATPAP